MTDDIKHLTVEQAERVAEEARFQGWETDDDSILSRGRVEIHKHWNPETREWMGTATVEVKLPGLLGPQFYVRTQDEWRRLKAKYDELKLIAEDAVEKGWQVESIVRKTGTVAMAIEVHPPSRPTAYLRVGGMRTWRKVLREWTAIEGSVVEDIRELPQ